MPRADLAIVSFGTAAPSSVWSIGYIGFGGVASGGGAIDHRLAPDSDSPPPEADEQGG